MWNQGGPDQQILHLRCDSGLAEQAVACAWHGWIGGCLAVKENEARAEPEVTQAPSASFPSPKNSPCLSADIHTLLLIPFYHGTRPIYGLFMTCGKLQTLLANISMKVITVQW